MTYEEFNEVYETYQPWIGRPIELLTANNNIGKTDYKKFILVQIKCGVSNEDRVKNEVFEPSVIIKDMVDSQIHQIPLEDFIKSVKLFFLGGVTTLNLSNLKKTAEITLDNSHRQVEFFIIQIHSHFGRPPIEWSKIASNISISFNLKKINSKSTTITNKLFLSTLITDQIQPVFYASKTFPNELQNNFQESEIIDTIEIIVEELVPLRENYEITIAFEKKP